MSVLKSDMSDTIPGVSLVEAPLFSSSPAKLYVQFLEPNRPQDLYQQTSRAVCSVS